MRSDRTVGFSVSMIFSISRALVIENPQVVQITMQGQKSFQISGDVKKEERISEEDIKMVMEQAGCSEEDAKAALEKNEGDIAQSILSLSEAKE